MKSNKALYSVHADLIVAILRDVANPRHGLVAALLDDLQVAHLDTRHGEVRNLKLELDGDTEVLVALFVNNTREAEGRAHMELFAARELLDDPDHGRLVGHVLDDAHVSLEDRRGHINGYRHYNLDVVRDGLLLELRACLNNIVDLGRREVFDLGADLDERLHLRVHAV